MVNMPDKQPESNTPIFPDPNTANKDGLLFIGGRLTPDWLLQAYRQGIFPWYSEEQPILWWSPDPRMVVTPDAVHISKTMKRFMNNTALEVRYNSDFEAVIDACQKAQRPYQDGTWITEEMKSAYIELHQLGHAMSVEVYDGELLVGGLYGIDLKDQGVFCGESMFSIVSNTSKLAFISLSRKLDQKKYRLIDCQMYTPHLESLGAYEIPRSTFLEYLQ